MNAEVGIFNDTVQVGLRVGDILADRRIRAEVLAQLAANLEISLSIGTQGLVLLVEDTTTMARVACVPVKELIADAIEQGYFDVNAAPQRTPEQGVERLFEELKGLQHLAHKRLAEVSPQHAPECALGDEVALCRDPGLEQRIDAELAAV